MERGLSRRGFAPPLEHTYEELVRDDLVMEPYKGSVAQVRIYDTALSSEVIRQLGMSIVLNIE